MTAFVLGAGLLSAVALLLAPPSVVTYDVGAVAPDAVKAEAGKALPPTWSDRQKRVATEIVKQFLDANVVLDPVATSVSQQAARTAVAPVQVQVVAGETVIREGSVVTALDVEKLRALGLASPGIDWRGALGLVVWALLVAGVLGLFMERY